MRILFTSHRFAPDIGGIETISELLVANFVKAGHSVRLLTQTPASLFHEQDPFQFPVVRQPSPRELLSAFRWADVVFQNNIAVRFLWPNFYFRKPLVIGLQTWIRSVEGRNDPVQRLKKFVVSTAHQSIACSDAIRRDCCPAALVIGNPYNDDLFRPLSGISRDRDIVFLGRLVSDKGVDLLLRAFARFSPPRPTLTIIGDGPERRTLEQLAQDLHLASSVVFAGALQGEPLVRILHSHQVLVVPSLWEEPFGVVALEGMACGCVVLASDGGGLPDAVGSAGVLFERGDVDSLHRHLKLLLADQGLCADLRARASSHLRNFHPEIVASRYLQVIEKAVLSG